MHKDEFTVVILVVGIGLVLLLAVALGLGAFGIGVTTHGGPQGSPLPVVSSQPAY